MNYKLKAEVKRFFKGVRGFFPSKTPVGKAEFHAWADDIIYTYRPPADTTSIKFALSAMIMRLNPTEAYKAKRFFALCLHKASAAQVACDVMEDIKQEQAAKQRAAQTAEVTATQIATNEQQAAQTAY